MRQVRDRLHVDRDVVALLAVAARHGAHEPPLFIGERDRGAVDLRLDGKGEVLAAEEFGKTGAEPAQLRLVVAVVQRGHRLTVLHAGKTLAAIVTNATRRRSGAER